LRHITPARLHELEPLLLRLRGVAALTERRPGGFYLGSRAFLHFHEHHDGLYADVRLDGIDFERMRVTTRAEQSKLVAAIRRCVDGR
jgi:hypothetical protein